jgi:hypothetical protein
MTKNNEKKAHQDEKKPRNQDLQPILAKLPVKIPEEVLVKPPVKAPEKVPVKTPAKAPEKVPVKTPEEVPTKRRSESEQRRELLMIYWMLVSIMPIICLGWAVFTGEYELFVFSLLVLIAWNNFMEQFMD